MKRTIGMFLGMALATGMVVACSYEDPDVLDGHRRGAAGAASPDAGSASSSSSASPDSGAVADAGAAADDAAHADGGATGDPFLQRNLDDINAHRKAAGVSPLVLDTRLDAFAQAGSVELSADHLPHAHFMNASTSGELGAAGFSGGAAENQGAPDGWNPMATDPTQNELRQIDSIIEAMFAEGPGPGTAHGHYTNLMNPDYHRLGVGLVTVNGKLFLTNDFSD